MADVDIVVHLKTTFWFWLLKIAAKLKSKKLIKLLMNKNIVRVKAGQRITYIKTKEMFD